MKEKIRNYFKTDTPGYGIFINGPWGSGKTYYIKNDLRNELEKEGVDLFYISVNGVGSTQDLKKSILANAFLSSDIPKRKSILGKMMDRALAFAQYSDKADLFFSVFKLSDFIKLSKTIFCFDDIERLSSQYDIKDFLGYINTEFIEHERCKVIFVGDLTKNQTVSGSFYQIREKYIRWIIPFESSISEVLNNLIESYKGSIAYYEHLRKYQEFIFAVMHEVSIANYRSVKFVLDSYSDIFKFTPEKYLSLSKEILYFSFVIGNEYQCGNLKPFDREDQLPSIVTQFKKSKAWIFDPEKNIFIDSDQIDDPHKHLIKRFETRFAKYITNSIVSSLRSDVTYQYISDIYIYITTGSFNIDSYVSRLKEILKAKKPELIREPNENVDALAYFENIDQNELDSRVEFVIEGIKKGTLDIYDFCRGINFLKYLASEKLINRSVDDIRELFKDNCNLIRPDPDLTDQDQFRLESIMRELNTFDKESGIILNKILEESIVERELRIALNELDNWEKSEDYQRSWQIIIEKCTADQISNKLQEMGKDRGFLKKVTKSIEGLYRANNSGDFFYHHSSNISNLREHLRKRNWSEIDRIDNYFVSNLQWQLNRAMGRISGTRSK